MKRQYKFYPYSFESWRKHPYSAKTCNKLAKPLIYRIVSTVRLGWFPANLPVLFFLLICPYTFPFANTKVYSGFSKNSQRLAFSGILVQGRPFSVQGEWYHYKNHSEFIGNMLYTTKKNTTRFLAGTPRENFLTGFYRGTRSYFPFLRAYPYQKPIGLSVRQSVQWSSQQFVSLSAEYFRFQKKNSAQAFLAWPILQNLQSGFFHVRYDLKTKVSGLFIQYSQNKLKSTDKKKVLFSMDDQKNTLVSASYQKRKTQIFLSLFEQKQKFLSSGVFAQNKRGAYLWIKSMPHLLQVSAFCKKEKYVTSTCTSNFFFFYEYHFKPFKIAMSRQQNQNFFWLQHTWYGKFMNFFIMAGIMQQNKISEIIGIASQIFHLWKVGILYTAMPNQANVDLNPFFFEASKNLQKEAGFPSANWSRNQWNQKWYLESEFLWKTIFLNFRWSFFSMQPVYAKLGGSLRF
ncbi:MAG: hypothetical protein D6767_09365 [Candidatus Hydrogenedentota bacterium]|nr:MAG: hypothetical protein D6767_09365 [Candidatus Hydrogenedentota bacterium]